MVASFGNVLFATLNVRGLCSRRKQYQLHRLILEENIDIFAVQETKLSNEEQVDEALRPFLSNFEVCVSHAIGTSAVFKEVTAAIKSQLAN